MITWGKTHIGHVRDVNEDCYMIHQQNGKGCLAVADGMGGHRAGEIASAMAIDLLRLHLQDNMWKAPDVDPKMDWLSFLREGVEKCNTSIYQASLRVPEYSGMGTTLTAALVLENSLYFAHVGDSRLYVYREDKLRLLSRDHSLVQDLVEEGLVSPREALTHPRRHILTQAVGTDKLVEVDTRAIEILPGDLYLLCTDGLSNSVSDFEIEQILSQSSFLARQGEALLDLANTRGGEDNVTIILARIKPDSWQGRI
jgi:serine/threonine protein phosphatase PrpC